MLFKPSGYKGLDIHPFLHRLVINSSCVFKARSFLLLYQIWNCFVHLRFLHAAHHHFHNFTGLIYHFYLPLKQFLDDSHCTSIQALFTQMLVFRDAGYLFRQPYSMYNEPRPTYKLTIKLYYRMDPAQYDQPPNPRNWPIEWPE